LRMQLQLLCARHPTGDAFPHVPPLGAALGRLGKARAARLELPQLLHAPLIQLGPEPWAHEKAAEIQPARLVLRTAPALGLRLPQRIPELPNSVQRPGVLSHAQARLQYTHQTDRVSLMSRVLQWEHRLENC